MTLLALAVSTFSAWAGYTHYFTWQKAPEDAALKECIREMNLLVEARKSMLIAPDQPGSTPGSPKLDAMRVDFNGLGKDAHEPFVFPGKAEFNFCKTFGKPYDEVVTGCLLVASDHFAPSVLSIDSDGSWEDWKAGASLYTSVLKRPAKNPLTEAESYAFVSSTDTRSRSSVLLAIALIAVAMYFCFKWMSPR